MSGKLLMLSWQCADEGFKNLAINHYKKECRQMIKWKVDKGTNEIYFKASNIFIKNDSNITPSRWLKPLKNIKNMP